MLVALDRPAQRDLNRAFNARAVRKHYVGVICGHFPSGRTLTIDLPLKQGRKSRYRVAGLREEIRPTRAGWTIDADGGHASKTRVRTIARGEKRTVVAIQPITGRSHQIRVHLSWIGHAVAGDHLYGSPASIEQASPRLATALPPRVRARLRGRFRRRCRKIYSARCVEDGARSSDV